MCTALADMVDDLRQKNEKLEADNTRLAAHQHERARTEKPGA
jgi:hypothetical protein